MMSRSKDRTLKNLMQRGHVLFAISSGYGEKSHPLRLLQKTSKCHQRGSQEAGRDDVLLRMTGQGHGETMSRNQRVACMNNFKAQHVPSEGQR